MRVLVACEYSGRVRDAFIRNGHTALSVDLLPSDRPGPHYQGDVLELLDMDWDLMVAHPPCTFLANSGAKHLYLPRERGEDGNFVGPLIREEGRWTNLEEGAAFFRALLEAPIPKIAIENPKMLGYAKKLIGADQSQSIQPWQFGHGETKETLLWLKGLDPLEPTDIVDGREQKVHRMGPSPDRWKLRSTTYQGVADAMGNQWGARDTP